MFESKVEGLVLGVAQITAGARRAGEVFVSTCLALLSFAVPASPSVPLNIFGLGE